MTIELMPELGVEITPDISYIDLRERAEAACRSALLLEKHGLDIDGTPADNVDNGVAAFRRGHYAIALRAWRGDAEKGNPWAQNNIGYLYEQGLGVG